MPGAETARAVLRVTSLLTALALGPGGSTEAPGVWATKRRALAQERADGEGGRWKPWFKLVNSWRLGLITFLCWRAWWLNVDPPDEVTARARVRYGLPLVLAPLITSPTTSGPGMPAGLLKEPLHAFMPTESRNTCTSSTSKPVSEAVNDPPLLLGIMSRLPYIRSGGLAAGGL